MAAGDRRSARLPAMPRPRAERILTAVWDEVAGEPAATLLTRAGRLAVPLVLIGASRAERRRLARAAHAVSERPGVLVVCDEPVDALPPGSTLLFDLEDDVAREVTAPAVEAMADDGDPWVLVAADTPALVPDAVAHEASALRLSVPRLAATEVVEAAREILADLADRAEKPVGLADDAAAWLREHADDFDRVLLARVLRRTLLALGPGSVIEAGQLALPHEPSRASMAPTVPQSGDAASAPEGERLEYVLAELAHELRNPLVTLKTVADHLDDLAEDANLRAHFRALGSEAVQRMDDLLDNLVTYGRLGPPAPRIIPLGALLADAVREASPALGPRRLSLRAVPGEASCWADPEHLGYALKNLLVGVAQTAHPDGELLVDASVNGVVRLRFATGDDAALLRSLVSRGDTPPLYDPAYQPLPFSLARAVLAKAGGRLQVGPAGEGRTAIEVHLPASV